MSVTTWGAPGRYGLCLLCRRPFQAACFACAKVHEPMSRFAAYGRVPQTAEACDACLLQIGAHLAGGKVKVA